MIRPPGPDPETLARGIPRSRAIFLAMGDAKIRSPEGSDSLDGVLGVVLEGCESLGGGGLSAFGSVVVWLLGGPRVAACSANAAAPERSSPSSATIAITEPIGTPLAPSCA
jgi:hypothetical protein